MISLIESYSDIIDSYEIKRYRKYAEAQEFVAIVIFKDRSKLHIRDYLFLDDDRKYSYHWQDQRRKLIKRWDNSAHHKKISTFPFQVHTSTKVEESKPMTLAKILEIIRKESQQ